ncbi:Rha family transcriptional regulator [Megamonas hypermegale]|uniref:Rha family transcriptional regulator n=1 Tax=Megamonas hypermegale TaxID=158847 RepID=UPI0026E9ADE8|nr:Rha family transcriptional regulator [Megamonas hypermegale]
MDNLIEIKNNQVVASSRQIAENFGKLHKDVLETIEKYIKAENSALMNWFYKTSYQAGTGKKYPMYLMNRDGFSLLVMGFTGKEALQWKIKYIDAFNAMEKKLNQQKQSTLAYDKYISLLDDKFMIGDIKSEPRVDMNNPKFKEVLSEANRLLITLTVLIKDWNNKYMRCNDFRGYYSAVVALASKFVQIIVSISAIKFDTIPDEKFQPNEL